MINKQDYFLLKLAEECAEVSQMVSKCLRFGMDNIKPGETLNNKERLIDELEDIEAILHVLKAQDMLHVKELSSKKVSKVYKWYEISKEKGFVE